MNTTRNSTNQSRAGFTLVELLVTLATLAVLAALVLPALAGTKPNSQLFQCLNNQKQLATAWLMYAPDNDGNVVGFNTKFNWEWRIGAQAAGALTTVVTATPPSGLSGEALFDWYIQEGYREGAIYKYAPNPAIIHCPGDKRKGSAFYYDSYSGVEGLNGGNYTAGVGNSTTVHNATPILKASGVKHPSGRFLWIEENDVRGDNIASWWFDPGVPYGSAPRWVDCPAVYHGTEATFSFADGHCASRQWSSAANTIQIAKAGTSSPSGIPSLNSDLTFIGTGYPCQENP